MGMSVELEVRADRRERKREKIGEVSRDLKDHMDAEGFWDAETDL